MHVCTQCATPVDLSRLGTDRQTCPDCGGLLREEAERPWTAVARVKNLAEAGFLSDELVGLGIDARIHQLNEFSAISDRCAPLYLIRVPTGMAHEAAARIRQYLAEEESDGEPEAATFCFSTHDQSSDPLLWRPVAIVILAGVASFVLGQRFSEQKEQKAERRPPRNSLAAAVEAIDRPFETEPVPGRPRYRLTFDRRREAWSLDSDRESDGVYDSTQAFPASSAAW
jgi:hypothetical protein